MFLGRNNFLKKQYSNPAPKFARTPCYGLVGREAPVNEQPLTAVTSEGPGTCQLSNEGSRAESGMGLGLTATFASLSVLLKWLIWSLSGTCFPPKGALAIVGGKRSVLSIAKATVSVKRFALRIAFALVITIKPGKYRASFRKI